MKIKLYNFSFSTCCVLTCCVLTCCLTGCAVDLSNGNSPLQVKTVPTSSVVPQPNRLESISPEPVPPEPSRTVLAHDQETPAAAQIGINRLPRNPPSQSSSQSGQSSNLQRTIDYPSLASPTVIQTDRQWSGVSRSELRDQAMEHHPALAAARADYQALQGKYLQTGLPPNPTAGVVADDINEDGAAGRYGVFFGRQIVRGGKLDASQAAVEQELQSAAFRVQEIQRRLLTDVDRFYFDVLIAQEQLALAGQMIGISQDAVAVSEALLESQEVPRTAVLQAQLQLKRSQIAGRRFDAAHLSAKRKLAAIIGQADLPTPQVAGNARDIGEVVDFETAYDQLLRDSPELSRLFADIETRKRELSRAQIQPISDVTWQTSLLYDFASDDIIGGFQIGWEIPTLNRNQGSIYQSSQQVVAAEHRAETKAIQLRQRLAEAYESYLDAKLQVEAFETDLLPIATETIQLLTQGYQAGETDALELLSAQRLLFQTRLTYLQNLRILGQQTASIEGLLLDDGLGASLNPQN